MEIKDLKRKLRVYRRYEIHLINGEVISFYGNPLGVNTVEDCKEHNWGTYYAENVRGFNDSAVMIPLEQIAYILDTNEDIIRAPISYRIDSLKGSDAEYIDLDYEIKWW